MRVIAILILLVVAAWSCNPKDKTKESDADIAFVEDTTQQGTPQEGDAVATPDTMTESEKNTPVLIFDSLEWTLFTIVENGNTIKISGEDKMTATFQGGSVSGFGGCNGYNGPYSATRTGSISVSNLGSSKKYCDLMMRKEATFFKVLEGVNSWTMAGNRLELKGSAGQLQFIHNKVRVIPN